jgi:multidrug efflux pump subunit AcrB
VDYGGLSRQYVQESSGFVTTFAFALIIIFLSLAALFMLGGFAASFFKVRCMRS